MGWVMTLIGRRRAISQAQLARRAAHIIEHVIFDLGVGGLGEGTVLLDRKYRLRFIGPNSAVPLKLLASVRLDELAETGLLRAACARDGAERQAAAHTDELARAVMRTLSARSPALRALPPGDA